MPPKSKKKIPPKKAVKVASKASESESEGDAPEVVPKSSGRRSDRQKVEEPKNTRASRGSQKENGSSKRKPSSRSSSSSSDSSDDEPIQPKSKTPPKKRKANGDAETGEASKQVPAASKQQIYEVEKIVGHEGNGRSRVYRIRWKGWGPESDTWEPTKKLNCPKLLAKYIAENPDAKHKAKAPKKSRKNKKKQVERPARVLKIDEQPDYDSEDIDENEDWEVEKIVDVHRNRDGTRDFLIRWKNYSSNSDSWEPESQLNCPDLIQKFMEKLKSLAVGEAKELRVNRPVTQRYTLMTQSAARRLSKRHSNKQRAVYYEAEL